MTLTVDFYYGLGSRYAYLASTQLECIVNTGEDREDGEEGNEESQLIALRGKGAAVSGEHPINISGTIVTSEWDYLAMRLASGHLSCIRRFLARSRFVLPGDTNRPVFI